MQLCSAVAFISISFSMDLTFFLANRSSQCKFFSGLTIEMRTFLGDIFSQFVTQLLTATSYVQAQGNNKKMAKVGSVD